jgi:hypothetical protein
MNKPFTQQSSRNDAVQSAYYATLKLAKQLLSTIEREELRYTLTRNEKLVKEYGLIHEFVNPLIYLRLEAYKDGTMGIHYGFEPCKEYANITVAFTRTLYRLSMDIASTRNLPDCIRLDWYIHNPDEMYAYVEEQNKYHTFQLIKHKVTVSKRKALLQVA